MSNETKICVECNLPKPASEFKYKNRCASCRKKIKTAIQREAQKKYFTTPKGQQQLLRNRLRKYDISVDQYLSLLEEQEGKCALCRVSEDPKKSLSVDHDHQSGRVRGLLCTQCNAIIERVLKSPGFLTRALDYLKGYSI